MDPARLENANELCEAGRTEEAALEFHAMAQETDDPDEKAATLANEHKCYCQLGQFDRANETMRIMRSLPVKDKFVRMIVDFGDASMVTQMGKLEEGALKFTRILEENQEQLGSPELRYLYEDIQERRAFALVGVDRHAEALPILKEAVSFTTDRADPQLVHFYLGVCYSSASEPNLAKEELLRAIGLGLSDQFEASARYRLAMLYFMSRAFAQAKLHLEAALALQEGVTDVELRRFIYQGLSRTCHYLGEFQEEQKYLSLAKSS